MKRPAVLLPLAFVAAIGALLLADPASASFNHICCNVQTNIAPPGTTPTVAQVAGAGAGDITITWNTNLSSDTTLYYGTAAPSWTLRPVIGGSAVNDVTGVNSQVQWAVNDVGVVYSTTDNWQTTTSTTPGASTPLYGVSATSGTNVWVVGTGGVIYHTSNGSTWSSSPSGTTQTLRAVKFIAPGIGIAVGDNGTILYTENAGVSWAPIDGGAYVGKNFYSLSLSADPTDLYKFTLLAGADLATVVQIDLVYPGAYTGPAITRTNFTLPSTSIPVDGVDIYRNPSTNQLTFWVHGWNFASSAGTWRKGPADVGFLDARGTGGGPNGGRGIVAISEQAAMYGDSNGVYQTVDGGVTWTTAFNSAGNTFYHGTHTSATAVSFVGNVGRVATLHSDLTSVSFNATVSGSHLVSPPTLSAATTYHFMAIDKKIVGPDYWQVYESANFSFTTRATDATPPSAPTGLTGTPSYLPIVGYRFRNTLSWTASIDAQSGIAGYEVSRNGTVIVPLVSATGYTDSQLASGTTYTYSIRARNGDGLWSAPATVAVTTLVPQTVTKTIGSGPGRDFSTLQAWEDARNGDLAYRSQLTVTPGTGIFATQETVNGYSGSTVSFVQDETRIDDAFGFSTTISDTFASPVTPGNLIVVSVGWGAAGAIPVVTDSVGNTYTLIDQAFGGTTQGHAVYYAKNVVGGSSVTVTATFSPSAPYRRLAISEYSGADRTAPLDTYRLNFQTNVGTGADAITSNTITTTTPNTLLYGSTQHVCCIDGQGTITAGAGYTLRETGIDPPGVIITTEDRTLATPGTAAATFTTGAAAQDFRTIVAAFKPAAGCTGRYVPENEVRTNGAVMTLDNFTGTCPGGTVLQGATSGATATFNSNANINGTREVGEAYKDSTFTGRLVVSHPGSLFNSADADHFLWLRPGPGQKHTGVAGTGVKLRYTYTGSGTLRTVQVDTPYTRIQGFEMQSALGGDSDTIIELLAGGTGFQLLENILHDSTGCAIFIVDSANNVVIRNNLIYRTNTVYEPYAIEFGDSYGSTQRTHYLYNNTIFASQRGGIGPRTVLCTTPPCLNLIAVNNTVVGSVNAAFGTHANLSYTGSSDNISGDATAPGASSLTGQSAAALAFQSTTAGVEDIRIKNGSVAIDAGAVTPPTGFTDDVVGRDRNDTVNFGPRWDDGAYEADKTPPTPAMAVGTVTPGWNATDGYTLVLNWTGGTTDPQSGVSRVEVWRDGALVATLPAGTLTYTDTNLAGGTNYTYSIRAINGDGFETTAGVSTATISGTFTLSLATPATNLVATAGGNPATRTVTVTSVSGFAGTVTFSDNVTAGTGSFAPASVALTAGGTATTTWTITAPAGTTPGNYPNVHAIGTAGPIVQTSNNGVEQVTDFSLSPVSAPASATVTVGGSTTFSFPVNVVNSSLSFPYSVDNTNPTSGLTFSYNPSQNFNLGGTALRTQSITVFTSGATPPGTYTIIPRVNYNGKTVALTPAESFSLTVVNPDFTLTLNPASASVNQGASTTFNAVLASQGGYAGTVTTTVLTPLPPGITVSPNPQTSALTAGSTDTKTFTLSVAGSTAAGSYPITVRSSDGTITRNQTFTLTVTTFQDFSLDITSSKTPTVLQGTNATYTVVATAIGSFSTPVTVSLASAPAGPTMTGALTLSSPGYTGTLTIATNALLPGTYTLTVSGTGGPGVRTVPGPVTLTVQANADFAFGTSAPTTQSVQAGTRATYFLTLTANAGYAGSVSLTAAGYPATIPPFVTGFNPTNVTPTPGGVTVELAVDTPYIPAAVGGPYTLTITGNDGTLTRSTTVQLTVTADTTPPVITSGPSVTTGFTTGTATWGTNEGSTSIVRFSVAPDTSLSSSASDTAIVTGHTVFLSSLTEDTTYNYRVESCNPFGLCTSSTMAQFTTLLSPDTAPPVISFVTPTNGQGGISGVLTITVNATDAKSGVATVQIVETGPLHPSGQILATLTGPGPNYTTTWDTNDPTGGDDNGAVTLTATAIDGEGNTATATITITLANDKTPPVITSNPEIGVTVTLCNGTGNPISACSGASTAVASLTWTTNEASTTAIAWGLESTDGSYTYTNTITLKDGFGNDIRSTNHQVDLVGLALNSRYHYQVTSCDASNNCVH